MSGQITSSKNQISSKLVKCQARAGIVRYGHVKSRSGQDLVRSDHGRKYVIYIYIFAFMSKLKIDRVIFIIYSYVKLC